MLCMDSLVGLCEWPDAGLRRAREAGIGRGHDAAQIGGKIFLVTCHHLQNFIIFIYLWKDAKI